jgi:DHA2 family multidrug resistance protein
MMPRAIVMMVATPIVGRLYNHVSPRLLVAVGVLLFSYGAYEMSHLALSSGTRDVILAIAVQGVGFACLFVSLNTTALSSIPRHLLPDATGLNSLFRQIGGSVGLAIFATLLSVYTTDARAGVSAHLWQTRPELQARLSAIQHAFIQRGMDAASAHAAAVRALAGIVSRQAGTLAFDKLFLLAGILFLLVLPLLIWLKVAREPSSPAVETSLEM